MLLKDVDVFWVHFLLGLTAVQCEWSVTHSSRRVCGLKGASVVLPCTYQYPWEVGGGDTYQRGELYKEKSQRVIKHSNSNYPDCSLNINKLSENHAGVYKFRFYTALHLTWITDKTGVVLSITDLQVKEEAVSNKQNQIKVTCSTSCILGSEYVWYKNGHILQGKTTPSILLDSTELPEKGNYYCAVRGYEAHRSPAQCVPRKQCWGVTYSSNRICELTGSSVDILCTYKYPSDHRIKTKYWFNKQKSNNHPEDLLLNKEYRNHVQYLGKEDHNCTLRLKDIGVGHSGEYGFRFTTEQGEGYTGLPGVTIIVTALQVMVTSAAVTEGERVTLTCSTTCTLSDHPTFTWFKNSLIHKHTTDKNLHFDLVQGHDSGNYSCAVRGHESLASADVFLYVRYEPKNVSVSLSPSGEIEEGSLVTLTCSSDANPPVRTYTWHFTTPARWSVMGTGESLTFNMTPVHSGLYHCGAQNEVGSHNSTGVLLDVKREEDAAWPVKAGIIIFMVIVILLALGIVSLRKWGAKSTANTQRALENAQSDPTMVYSNVSAHPLTSDLTQRVDFHGLGDVQYASVRFSRTRRQEASSRGPEEDCVVYSNVRDLSQSWEAED
ncbi:B-cell receptor CD22-like isoform X2 [Alosa pseudoharengus]|uniref:B-cell receptor CD22-like isoform X2 n=1 Tax=Alosa pseudoharengus TaxID=34774 RepID=UPI003F8AA533